MAPALELALAGGANDRLRQVVFVTDGAVGNEDELFTLIRQRLGESRLFTVGIGAAPNGHFMTQAALWGRGTHVRIASQAEVGERMDALLAMLERPALTDVALSFPGGPADVEHWPDRIPDLYAGEPVLVAARVRGAAGPDRRWVRLEGRQAGGHWLRELPLPAGDDAPGVAALWARAKIAGLERRLLQPGAADAVRAELEQVALAHGLVSRYTSLVAVDRETPPAPAAPAAARPVPLLEPAGAEGIRLGELTATGTPSRQLLARGALLAVLALLVLAFDPRRAPRWD
jgi:Ca-activated chloride channel family protein